MGHLLEAQAKRELELAKVKVVMVIKNVTVEEIELMVNCLADKRKKEHEHSA